MSKFIKDLLESRIAEKYNPNDRADEYSQEYVKRITQARRFDPFDVDVDGEVEPEDFFAHLRDFVYSHDDEVTVHYPNGTTITLDVEVVKQLLANSSAEQIEHSAIVPEYMHELIRNLGLEVIALDGEEE